MSVDEFALRRTLETVLELPSGSLDAVSLVRDLPHWDSLALVSFITTVDEKYGRALRGIDIQNAATLTDLVNLINASC